MEQQRKIEELDTAKGEKLPDQPWHLHKDFPGSIEPNKIDRENEETKKLEGQKPEIK